MKLDVSLKDYAPQTITTPDFNCSGPSISLNPIKIDLKKVIYTVNMEGMLMNPLGKG